MLIDTSGWFSIFDTRQASHQDAVNIYREASRHLTHSFIVAEFVALTDSRRAHRSKMLEFLSYLLRDYEVEIIWVGEAITRRAATLLAARRDKNWSLCDSVSFVLMNDLSIDRALTTDHHFEQAGFTKLLES